MMNDEYILLYAISLVFPREKKPRRNYHLPMSGSRPLVLAYNVHNIPYVGSRVNVKFSKAIKSSQ